MLTSQLKLIEALFVECDEFDLSEEKIASYKAIINYIMVPLVEFWFKYFSPPVIFNSNSLIYG